MSALSRLAKKIRKRIQDAENTLDAHYPPALTGQPETDFDAAVQDAGNDSDDILQESFFSGITPATKTKPTTSTMIEWFADMAETAQTIVNSALPTPAQEQDAADYYHTISQDRGDLISEYTT